MTWNRKIRPEQTEGLVPYTGSTQNIDLGTNTLLAASFTGSLQGTASFAISSSQASSSSFSSTSSFVTPLIQNVEITGSLKLIESLFEFESTQNSGVIIKNSGPGLKITSQQANALEVLGGSNGNNIATFKSDNTEDTLAYISTDGSIFTTGSLTVIQGITGSLLGTASFANISSTTNAISGTVGYIPKFNTGSTIDDSIIFQSGSSIGIGTETPTQVLDVNGNVRFRRSGTTTFTIGGGQSAATVQDGIINIVSSLNDNLILDTRRAREPRIYSTNRTLEISSPNATNILLKPVTTGNIGIGTSDPTFKLEVSGSTRITDDLRVEGNIIKDIKIIPDTTYTLLNTDRNKILHFTSATDVTITIPTGLSSTNRYEGKQLGTGQLIFGTDMGVTLYVGASELTKTAEQYSVFGLDVIGTEEYVLFGKLELA